MFCPVCHQDYPPDWKACPKDATTLLRTSQIGKYTVDGLLGVGGMGAVYRAVNPDTKGQVAIKVMNPAVAGADSARARFQREAAAVAALNTTHVVKVYDFGAENDGTLYLVMEFLRGHALRDEIAPLPDTMHLSRVQMVFEGALRGLVAAHKAGIVHRDLKPENIYVAQTDDGEVAKLLDFGIARVRTKESDLTRTGAMMGTASYMAPEQIAGNMGTIGPWSDIYSMGVILYELLSGTPAFGGNTITDVLSRVLKSELAPLQTIRTDLPDGVYDMVARCMSLEPAKRPQDAEAFRALFLANRLVPIGTLIPDARTSMSMNFSVGSTGIAATEGSVDVRGSSPGAPRPSTPASGNVGFGPTVRGPAPTGEAKVSTDPIRPPAGTSKLPLILAGVAVLGVGGFFAIRAMGGKPTTITPKDAAAIATTTPDAAAAADCEGAAATFIARLGDRAPKAMSGTIRSLVAKHCVDDHWSSEAVQCVRDAKDDAAVTTCTGKLTRDQGKLLEDNVLVAMSQAESATLHDNMVKIVGGTFDLGEDKAQGERLKPTKATVADFWIDKHEVTRGDLAKAAPTSTHLTSAHPETKDDTDATPLRFVDWAFADAYCQKAGKRLPTESEWEVAARTTPSVTDPNFDHSKARLRGKDRKKTTEADLGAPSDCSKDGLCDMLGGLIEWTADDMPKQPGKKVARGASYATFQDGVSDTIHNRFALDKKKIDNTVGFRCAATAK